MYLEKFRLEGKTAFVTGGGRGIGLCAAEALCEAGAKVVISDIDEAVLASGCVDLADYEMDNEAADVSRVRALAQRHGLPLVLSFHDFQRTPAADELAARFAQAHRLGADVAKVAVMPQSLEDVHRLLGATLHASRTLPIPVISMAMGGLGAVSRVCGGVFGSALTFAVGSTASAPGQMPIEDVRAVLAALERAGS